MEVKKDEFGADLIEIALKDWRLESPGEVLEAESPEELPVQIKVSDTEVRVTFNHGDKELERTVWIELEAGNVRVHAYNMSKDSPLNVDIPMQGEIRIDNHDYADEELKEDVPAPAA